MRFYVREMFLLAEPIVHQNWHHGPREVLDTSTRANSSANIASGSSNASFSTCATGGSVVENLFSDVDDIETKMPVPEKAWLLSTIFFTTQLLIGAPSTDWKSCNRLGIILAILHTCLLAFFSVHHFTYLHCSESSKLVKALLVFGQCCSFLGACGKLTCRLGTELSSHDWSNAAQGKKIMRGKKAKRVASELCYKRITCLHSKKWVITKLCWLLCVRLKAICKSGFYIHMPKAFCAIWLRQLVERRKHSLQVFKLIYSV